ncbi:MAG: UvrD-helicase domain-containing protein, partial [Anaerolineales bacterium]|nr:UvrD-helicase domain-containing protein [Anaerolineales bacterium]
MSDMEKDIRHHPILQQMQPSPEQKAPIFSRGQDIAVTAGAGTGKTRTLVARFLSLLAEGTSLRSIVAITFTKKAAREMRNRIREEVRLFLERADLSIKDRSFWMAIYEGLDAARISTIHSLAADILRHHPAEMKLDPLFELLEDGEMARLKSQAVEKALGWAANDPEAASLFVTFGDWQVRRIVNELLAKSLDVRKALAQMPADLWSVWQPYLVQPLKDFVEHPLVESGLEGFISLEDQGLVTQAETSGDALVSALRIVIDLWKKISIAHQEDDWVEISRHLGLLRNHLKQKGRKENWAPANPKAVIKEIQNVYDSVLGSNNLDLSVDQNLAQRVIPALMAVYQHADLMYSETKSRLHVLDYDDLEEKSLQLLMEFPDVRKYWQNQINGLLVDEFQDTNGRQRDLVFLLNGKNQNLFIVGDGKQSIYRFRGADVAVFREELSRIEKSGSNFQLTTSYRAHPGLLQDLNSILKLVLGDDDSLSYVEPFSPLQPGRDDASAGIELPFVELHLAAGSKSAGALNVAGEALAYRLKELVESENISIKDSDSSEPRMLTYRDIAVLCRASGSFPAYEAAFERAGIPYLTIAGQGFYDRPEIRDVLNALLAISEPENDLALAGLLRSPAGGISDAALVKLRDFQTNEDLPTLLEAARHAREVELGDEFDLVLKTITLVDEVGSYVGRISVAEILGIFLERSLYIPALTKFGLHRSVQNLKKFITEVQTSGETSITSFLNSISELRSVAVREGEAQAVAEGAVQIMTVHQSKGLEFPVVVLGDASKRERYGRDILIDERFGLVLPYSEEHVQP